MNQKRKPTYQISPKNSLNLGCSPPVSASTKEGSSAMACEPHHSHCSLCCGHHSIRSGCGGCSHSNCVLVLLFLCLRNVRSQPSGINRNVGRKVDWVLTHTRSIPPWLGKTPPFLLLPVTSGGILHLFLVFLHPQQASQPPCSSSHFLPQRIGCGNKTPRKKKTMLSAESKNPPFFPYN